MKAVPLLLCGLLVLSACHLLPKTRTVEPGHIKILNHSDTDLAKVTLSAPLLDQPSVVRVGSVSPVPRGLSAAVTRHPDPPPLPDRLGIEWSDARGKTFRKSVLLTPLLKTCKNGQETLVIEILPDHSLKLRLEEADQPSQEGHP